MAQNGHLRLTREALYELVWARPMTQVAKDYQISDRAMAKLCARKQIPVPPRGYWAKIKGNRDAAKPSLPAFVLSSKRKSLTQDGITTSILKATKKKQVKPPSIFAEQNSLIKARLKEFRKSVSEGLSYIMRVESWNADYSFGLNQNYDPLRKHDEVSFIYERPFNEHRSLAITGKILEPSNLKGQKIETKFFPKLHLNETNIIENLRRYEENPPKAIGSFQREDSNILAIVSIPKDAWNILLQNIVANKINFITLYGERMRYGRGPIFRFHLQERQGEDVK